MGLGVNPTLNAMLEAMKNPQLKAIDLSLSRMEKLMAALGHPERQLPPTIHIAGTNGKGSLVAYLRAMLEAEGKLVHAYTSPHLVRFHERFRLAGEVVNDTTLENALRRVEAESSAHPSTFFEATTAAGFLMFAEHPADMLLLEVGLGGRLDATNVIESPILTAITPISLDHCEFLGNDITSIACEKAGIIKPGVPVVVGPQTPEALAVIDAVAAERGSKVYAHGREWTLDGHYFRMGEMEYLLPEPSLAGAHQIANAATAVAVMQVLKLVSFKSLDRGIRRADWPARLQPIKHIPWILQLPAGSKIWLDGGHNPGAAEMLAAWMRAQPNETIIICGMLATKDAASYLRIIAQEAKRCFTVPIEGEEAVGASALAELAEQVGMQSQAVNSVEEGLTRIQFEKPVNVLICGSLYLAGDVLSQLA